MNVTRRPAASLSAEAFDAETVALLAAIEVELPHFGDVELDIAFGTPLDMYEASELPHERLRGLDVTSAGAAIQARHDRLIAAADIAADDPSIAARVRSRLVDVLLPYATQLAPARTAAPAAAVASLTA